VVRNADWNGHSVIADPQSISFDAFHAMMRVCVLKAISNRTMLDAILA
jgi:hypothetical protein